MSKSTTTIPIYNNKIKSGFAKGQEHETVLLGAQRVTVGISTGEKVIKEDATGWKKEVNEVVDQQIYNLPTQARSAWFTIDLESGDNWNPDEDQELRYYKAAIEEVEPGSEQYLYYKEKIREIYENHPAFIRANNS